MFLDILNVCYSCYSNQVFWTTRNTTLNLTPTFRESIFCPTLKQKKSIRNLPEALKSPFYVGHNSWALKCELTCVICVTILWIKINLTVVRLFNWNFIFFLSLTKIWILGTFYFLLQQMPRAETNNPPQVSSQRLLGWEKDLYTRLRARACLTESKDMFKRGLHLA